MGWTTYDGLHEGYLLPEFGDGQVGRGIVGGGVPDDQVIVDVTYVDQRPRYATRPASEVVGWRVMCDCRTSDETGRLLPEEERWRSDLIVRAAFAADEDVLLGRIHAKDDQVTTVGDGGPVAELVHDIWMREHVRPLEVAAKVTQARDRVVAATRELDRALAEARRTGVNEHLIRAVWSQAMAGMPHRVPGRPREPFPIDRLFPGLRP